MSKRVRGCGDVKTGLDLDLDLHLQLARNTFCIISTFILEQFVAHNEDSYEVFQF